VETVTMADFPVSSLYLRYLQLLRNFFKFQEFGVVVDRFSAEAK